MANNGNGFNLSEAIRDFRKSHRGVSANDALAAMKKANAGQKINEGTFRATFYKLAGNGKRKRSVKRRRPGSLTAVRTDGDAVFRAGLNFIRLAGGVENAKERLAGLKELIETAKSVN